MVLQWVRHYYRVDGTYLCGWICHLPYSSTVFEICPHINAYSGRLVRLLFCNGKYVKMGYSVGSLKRTAEHLYYSGEVV